MPGHNEKGDLGMQRRFSSELSYVLGIVLLAFGTTLMTVADLGLSMVVAPAYLLHLKLSAFFPAVTFGRAEYIVQVLLLAGLCAGLRKFRPYFLFSFFSAIFYGIVLDLFMLIPFQAAALPGRIGFFAVGALLCTLGVSFVLHTYLAPEVYELVVKEISLERKLPSGRVKTITDCSYLTIAVILSFLFFGFGHFRGIGVGTIPYALCAGTLVGFFNRVLERYFFFQATFPKAERFFLSPDREKDETA